MINTEYKQVSPKEFERIKEKNSIYLTPDEFKSLCIPIGTKQFVYMGDIFKYGKEEAIKNHAYTIKWVKDTLNLDDNKN